MSISSVFSHLTDWLLKMSDYTHSALKVSMYAVHCPSLLQNISLLSKLKLLLRFYAWVIRCIPIPTKSYQKE